MLARRSSVLFVLLALILPSAAMSDAERVGTSFASPEEALAWLPDASSADQLQIREAQRLLERVRKSDPDNADLVAGLAQVARLQSEWKLARKLAREATELRPDDAKLHVDHAAICFASLEDSGLLSAGGIAKRARKALDRALEIDPYHADALEYLAGYYLFAPAIVGGNKERGEALAQRLAATDEGAVRGNLLLATRFSMAGNLERGDKHFELAERAAGEDPEAIENVVLSRAGVALRDKQHDKVIAIIEPYVEEWRPESANAYFLLGTALKETGRCEDAIPQFVRVLEFAPDAVNAPVSLGVCLEALGRFDEALEVYNSYIEMHPKGDHAKKVKKAIKRTRKKLKS